MSALEAYQCFPYSIKKELRKRMPYGCTLKLFYLIAEEERDRPKWRLELVDPGSDKTYSFDIALLQVFIHPCPYSPTALSWEFHSDQPSSSDPQWGFADERQLETL
jgi:hypothetical protein